MYKCSYCGKPIKTKPFHKKCQKEQEEKQFLKRLVENSNKELDSFKGSYY